MSTCECCQDRENRKEIGRIIRDTLRRIGGNTKNFFPYDTCSKNLTLPRHSPFSKGGTQRNSVASPPLKPGALKTAHGKEFLPPAATRAMDARVGRNQRLANAAQRRRSLLENSFGRSILPATGAARYLLRCLARERI